MNIIKILLLLSITLFLNANEKKLEKVTLQLQWKHQFEFAGFYAAKEKGFYRDIGLDVELVSLKENTDIVDEVISQRADYGVSYSSIVAEYLSGKPIVFVANFFKQSPLVLVTQKHITSLSQLRGSKVEGLSNNINNITLHAMLKKFAINPHDIETIPPTFSIDKFVNKEVDAIGVFTTNEPYLLDKAGIQYNIFDPVSYGVTYYDTNLFTSKDEAINNPLRVQKFKEASIKGWEYALKHQDEIVELILKKYNTQNKSRESLLFEAKQVEQVMLPTVHEVGSISLARVEILAEDFIQSGFVKDSQKYNLDDFIFEREAYKKNLTESDFNYLRDRKNLKICVDPDWMPIEAIVDSKYIGMGSDYLKLFESKLGIDIDVLKTESWSGSLEAMKQRKCDILSLSTPTESREKSIVFTDQFLELSLVIVALEDKKSVIDFSLLDGRSIAVVKGYSLVDKINKKYPYIKVVEVRNIDDGLRKVESGEVFGFADSAVVIDYAYNNGTYKDFKIIAHFDEKVRLGLGVNKKDKKLHNILQKVVKNITPEQKQSILKKWFSTKYKKQYDYKIFFILTGFLLLAIVFVSYVYFTARKSNKELNKKVQEELEKSKEKDRMIFHQNKLAAMGEMIENIAHQWRQPLSQVNSAVLIIDDALDEKGIIDEVIEEKLLEIESLTKYMSNTINDFRDYFNHNKVKDSFILEKIIEKSLKVLNGKIKLNSIEISSDLENEHICFGYPNELQQVLLAILNNAIDALVGNNIQNSKIEINVKRDAGYNYIIICDNGGGIGEEEKEKIFEPYYTTKHKTQGTGLGLYISKVIVEDSLGGYLSVEDSSDGACFIIKLRVKDD